MPIYSASKWIIIQLTLEDLFRLKMFESPEDGCECFEPVGGVRGMVTRACREVEVVEGDAMGTDTVCN